MLQISFLNQEQKDFFSSFDELPVPKVEILTSLIRSHCPTAACTNLWRSKKKSTTSLHRPSSAALATLRQEFQDTLIIHSRPAKICICSEFYELSIHTVYIFALRCVEKSVEIVNTYMKYTQEADGEWKKFEIHIK